MGKKSHKRMLSEEPAVIKVFINFEVKITEVYMRNEAICDEHTCHFNFEFGNDFPRAKYWLESDNALSQLSAFSNEMHDRWAIKSGGKS